MVLATRKLKPTELGLTVKKLSSRTGLSFLFGQFLVRFWSLLSYFWLEFLVSFMMYIFWFWWVFGSVCLVCLPMAFFFLEKKKDRSACRPRAWSSLRELGYHSALSTAAPSSFKGTCGTGCDGRLLGSWQRSSPSSSGDDVFCWMLAWESSSRLISAAKTRQIIFQIVLVCDQCICPQCFLSGLVDQIFRGCLLLLVEKLLGIHTLSCRTGDDFSKSSLLAFLLSSK